MCSPDGGQELLTRHHLHVIPLLCQLGFLGHHARARYSGTFSAGPAARYQVFPFHQGGQLGRVTLARSRSPTTMLCSSAMACSAARRPLLFGGSLGIGLLTRQLASQCPADPDARNSSSCMASVTLHIHCGMAREDQAAAGDRVFLLGLSPIWPRQSCRSWR